MGQNTLVTALITDPSGNPYKNCSFDVSLVNLTGSGTLINISGSTFQTQYNGGSCDSTGTLIQPLFDSTVISPAGTQWKFNVCDITGKTCFSYTTPACPTAGCITGASINISAAISAVAPTLTQAGIANVGANNTFIGNNSFTGSNTFSGVLTSSNTFNVCRLSGIRFVDAANTCAWVGSDIGGWLNSAYADLPSTGGEIDYACKTDGTAHNYSTPITFTTAGKPVVLRAIGAADQNGKGCALNYTPTTATAAITLDYFGNTGGGYAAQNGLIGVTLSNNGCVTIAGCGSSATGIQIGNTNGGAGAALFQSIKVTGFSVGFAKTNPVSWGQTFENCSFAYNATGVSVTTNENDSFISCRFAVNGTAIANNGGDLSVHGGSIDSNTVGGIVCSGSIGVNQVGVFGVHFENLNTTNTHYLSGPCNFQVFGGIMLNDSTTSTTDWYINPQGNNFVLHGTEFQSAGQTVTNVISLAGGSGQLRGLVAGINISPTTGISTIVDTSSAGRLQNVTNMTVVGGNANAQTDWTIQGNITPTTVGVINLGSTALPYGGLFLANGAAANSLKLAAATQTANKTATFPDNTGTVAEINLAQLWSATQRGISWVSDQGTACTNGELALSAGWGTTATVTAVAGTGQTCHWTITSSGTGQAANPTITDTLTNALPTATTVCDMRMEGGTGTNTLINQTTLSATAPVFTFNGTPVAASTYIVVRRCGP